MKSFVSRLPRFTAQKHTPYIICVALFTVLAVKFLYPIATVTGPIAYDTGINRYLFLRYAEAFPVLPDLASWSKEHPPLLFYFVAPFVKFGLPVDWVIGWMWNLFCIGLIVIYMLVVASERSEKEAVALLAMAVMSRAYFDGFAAMYWKNYAAFLLLILCYHFASRRQWYAVPLLVLCMLTHHVTGLVGLVSLGAWWTVSGLRGEWKKRIWITGTAGGLLIIVIGGGWYALVHREFLVYQLKLIFGLADVPVYGGAFPDLKTYLKYAPVTLLLGLLGFVMSWRKTVVSPWQYGVLCCMAFVLLKLYFHNRFFLQLDFLLMYFGARALVALYDQNVDKRIRYVATGVIALQMVLGLSHVNSAQARHKPEVPMMVDDIPSHVESDAKLLVPENQSAPVVLGWVPELTVWAPGLYGFGWNQDQWNRFVFGEHDERAEVAKTLPSKTYVVITPTFFSIYSDRDARAFIDDPCFETVERTILLRVDCS